MPNHYKKAWSLVFKGVVWAEFKLLVGIVLIISLGPGSSAGKVGTYEWVHWKSVANLGF